MRVVAFEPNLRNFTFYNLTEETKIGIPILSVEL